MAERVACPTCEGKGEHGVYVCPGFRYTLVRCKRCDGSRTVTAAEAERVADGKQRADYRKARGLSLREEAARLGITPMALADIEHARVRGDGR